MSLSKKDYLDFKLNEDGETIYHIKSPCKFTFKEFIVNDLKEKYLPGEEIGGVIWVKPQKDENDNYNFVGDKITFIRNAIEDRPNKRNRTKRNSYLADREQKIKTLNEVFRANYLPIFFHTHPTKGGNFLNEFINFNYQRETSEQDRKVSERPLSIGNEKLLLPRGLVVGNDAIRDNLFIGVYNGFIAPKGFEQTKDKVVKENMDSAFKAASNIQLTDSEKFWTGMAILLLVIVIVRYRKYSLPIILGMGAMIPFMLENTDEESKYYSQSLSGDVIINIPDYEGNLKNED